MDKNQKNSQSKITQLQTENAQLKNKIEELENKILSVKLESIIDEKMKGIIEQENLDEITEKAFDNYASYICDSHFKLKKHAQYHKKQCVALILSMTFFRYPKNAYELIDEFQERFKEKYGGVHNPVDINQERNTEKLKVHLWKTLMSNLTAYPPTRKYKKMIETSFENGDLLDFCLE